MGRAAALRFGEDGAKLVLVGRTGSTLEAVREQICDAGGEASVAVADVGTEEGAVKSVGSAVEVYGGLDVLINNAGVGWSYEAVSPGSMAGTADTPTDAWRDVVRINLESVHLMCRSALPEFRGRGGGVIVNVSSTGGTRGMSDAHAYSAAKAGVINLTRSIARTYGPEDIRCNCLCPGITDTGMIDPYREIFDEALSDAEAAAALCPLKRLGTAEEAADGIVFLATASYCNGTILVMDGGLTV